MSQRRSIPTLSTLVFVLTATAASAQLGGPVVQYWHENVPGVWDDAIQNDQFGTALAVGDFNDDGVDDLAIGVPNAQVGTVLGAGAVHVLYGRVDTALYPLGQYWYQGLIRSDELNETSDWFGYALAAGDFDGDGVDDLAIGSPGEKIGGDSQAGQVQVIFGVGGSGLSNQRSQLWHQDRSGVSGETEIADAFGMSLAAGDFNADGIDDLAVGVPREGLGGIFSEYSSAGAVQVFPGQWGTGLTTTGAIWLEEGATIQGYNISGSVGTSENFGWSLAVGDFNFDGADDLAVGVPGENSQAGIAYVIMGWVGFGLTGRGSQVWSQDSAGIPDSRESSDQFGWSVAAGDWNDDGFDDLAIGAPSEKVGTVTSAGTVHTLYGSINGITATGTQQFTQDTGSIQDVVEAGDFFGRSLASGDFDADGRDDLAISAMGEGLTATQFGAGVVHLLFGSSTGVTTTDNQLWSQNSRNVGGTAADQTYFGFALAAGDFDADGADDLAIGAPYDDPGIVDAGSVNVLLELDESGLVIGFQ